MIQIEIQGYGVLRQLAENIVINLQEGCSLVQIKDALILKLGQENEAIIHDSVLASDDKILPCDFVVTKNFRMYILPPVCGG